MLTHVARDKRRSQQGSMLLEVLIALLIFSVGILALVGLQAGTVANATDAKFRTDAAFLAEEMISRLLLDQGTVAAVMAYNGAPPTDWSNRVAARLPGGSGDIAVVQDDANSHQPTATVTITWRPPGQTTDHTFSTTAAILKSQPLP